MKSKRKKNLTSAEVQEILKLYPNTKTAQIAKLYNISVAHVYKTAQRYGVKKSVDFMSSPASGRIQRGQCLSPTTQFKKGHIPACKGQRIESMMKKQEKIENWRKNLWKKGNKPHSTAKDGEVRWREGVGYYFIRHDENDWEFYHRYLWKQKYGEIPEGHNIVFKDGNQKNCVIENLECLSNMELGEKNRITKYPVDLRRLIITNNKLLKEIKNYE